MQVQTKTEFLVWAKRKLLTFVAQMGCPNLETLLPSELLDNPNIKNSCANLYTNKKNEFYLAIWLDNDSAMVFKYLPTLK